jgi:mono/diheme cytochrome c family protein
MCAGAPAARPAFQPARPTRPTRGRWRSAGRCTPSSARAATAPTWRASRTGRHPDQLLFEITKRGGQASSPPGYKNNMPAFGGALTDQEIWAVLAYIKSEWPPDIRAAQEQTNR